MPDDEIERTGFFLDFDAPLFGSGQRWKIINSHVAPLGAPMSIREACRLFEKLRVETPDIRISDVFGIDELLLATRALHGEQALPIQTFVKMIASHAGKKHEPVILSNFDYAGLAEVIARFFPPDIHSRYAHDLIAAAPVRSTGLNGQSLALAPEIPISAKLDLMVRSLERTDGSGGDFDRIFYYYSDPAVTPLLNDLTKAQRDTFKGGRNALYPTFVTKEATA